MEKTKIPTLKKCPVSSIPVPVKSNGILRDNVTKTQSKLPSTSQVSLACNTKKPSKGIFSNSTKISEDIGKVSRRLTSSKTKLPKNAVPVLNNKLKDIKKFPDQRVNSKSTTISLKSAASSLAKRIPPPASACNQKRPPPVARESKTISTNQRILRKPTSISQKVTSYVINRVPSSAKDYSQKETFAEKRSNTISKNQKVLSKPAKNSVKSVPSNALRSVPLSAHNINQKRSVAEKKSKPFAKVQPMAQKPKVNEVLKPVKISEPAKLAPNIVTEEAEAPVIIKQKEPKPILDEEFKASNFYKNLILSERELSPGIMKLCAEEKFASMGASMETLVKKSNYSSADLVENLKRMSARYLKRQGSRQYSPYMPHKSSPFKVIHDMLSVKENLGTKFTNQGMLGLRHKMLEKSISGPEKVDRRWTCNNILTNANARIIDAAELRRMSEMHRQSFFQGQNKRSSILSPHPISHAISRLTPIKGNGFPLSKRKNKLQKKVTFNIPSINSPDIMQSVKGDKNNFKKSCLINIDKGSNQMGTSKSDINTLNNATNTVEAEQCVTNRATFSQFNLNSDKSNSDLFLTRISEENQKIASESATPEFDLKITSNEQLSDSKDRTPEFNLFSYKYSNLLPTTVNAENPKIERQSATPEFDLKILSNDQLSKNPKCYLDVDSESSSNQSDIIIVDQKQDIPNIECPRDNSPPKIHCASPSVPKCSPSIIQSLEKLGITSPPYASKTKTFLLNPEQNIYTPRPISLHQNSYLRDSISPYLAGQTEALCPFAPICTPFVLKSMANATEVSLSPVRQKLNFNEEPKLSDGRRESQIVIQNIPTFQKMQDCLCDQECNILSMQTTTTIPTFRLLQNPIAKILNRGDEMHFVPVYSP